MAVTSLMGCKCIDSEVFTVIAVSELILPFENQPSRQVICLKKRKIGTFYLLFLKRDEYYL